MKKLTTILQSLKACNLTTLHYSQIRGDTIVTYKIIFWKYNSAIAQTLLMSDTSKPRRIHLARVHLVKADNTDAVVVRSWRQEGHPACRRTCSSRPWRLFWGMQPSWAWINNQQECVRVSARQVVWMSTSPSLWARRGIASRVVWTRRTRRAALTEPDDSTRHSSSSSSWRLKTRQSLTTRPCRSVIHPALSTTTLPRHLETRGSGSKQSMKHWLLMLTSLDDDADDDVDLSHVKYLSLLGRLLTNRL